MPAPSLTRWQAALEQTAGREAAFSVVGDTQELAFSISLDPLNKLLTARMEEEPPLHQD